jgi:predicted nucleic-acid-binding protein
VIALDTNALVRVLIEDDKNQAFAVQNLINFADKNSIQILLFNC